MPGVSRIGRRSATGALRGRRAALATALVPLVFGAALAASTIAAPRAGAQAPPDAVYVVDAASGQLVELPVGSTTPTATVAVGTDPQFVALAPDGSTAFVTNSGSASVSVVDLVTGSSRTIPVGSGPEGVAVSLDGSRAYVVDAGSNAVTPIEVATGEVGEPIPAGVDPYGIALAPNGTEAYVTDAGDASVTPITLSTGTPGTPIPVGLDPEGIAITPNGATLYVADAGSNTLTPISTATGTPGAPIPVGPAPTAVAITPDGSTALVADSGSDEVTLVDLASGQATGSVVLPGGVPPTGVVVAPSGQTAYVTSATADVVVPIALSYGAAGATGVAGPPIRGFSGPVGISVTPDQAPLAALSASAATVSPGTEVSFDASASTVAYGTITAYQWFFGDGTPPVVTSTPTATHTFESPGSFQVTVLEEDSAGTSYLPSYTGQTASRNVPERSNGLPQSAATVDITVSGQAISTDTPEAFVADLGGDALTPVGIPEGQPPSTSSPALVGSPVAAGNAPAFVAVTPDARALVASDFGGDTLTPFAICRASGTLGLVAGTPAPTGPRPAEVAIAPAPLATGASGTQWAVYVADSGGSHVRAYVLTVQASGCAASLSVPASGGLLPASLIPVGDQPYGIAITPDGSRAYVTDTASGTVTPIDLATGQPGAPIPVGTNPEGIAVTPDGKTVYVVDAGSNAVTPIATSSDAPSPPIAVGPSPSQIAIADSGATAYVTDLGSDTVSEINLANGSVTSIPLPEGAAPTAVAVTPDGTTAYVTSYAAGALYAIDTATGSVVATAAVGLPDPVGVAITPDQAPLAKLAVGAAVAGSPVTFDASGSTVAYGTITAYQWFFGDGTPPVVTSTPTVTHTYADPGTYDAEVLEEDSAGTSYLPAYTGQTASRNVPIGADGLPQSAAGAVVQVSAATTPSVPAGSPVLYAASLTRNELVPLGISSPGTPVPATPVPVGSAPAFPAATPDGTAVVVSDFGANALTPVAVCPNSSGGLSFEPGSPVGTAEPEPAVVAVDPVPLSRTSTETQWLVVAALLGGNDVQEFVLTVQPSACSAELAPKQPISASLIPVGASPYGVVITPNGATAYVTNSGAGTVTPIDLSSGQPGPPIPVGQDPEGIAVTPDGSTVLVVDDGSNAVTPISTSTNLPGPPIAVGSSPEQLAVLPSGSAAYVTDTGSDALTPIELPSLTAGAPIPLPTSPNGIAASPDGSTLYVGSYDGSEVLPVSVATGTVASAITGVDNPVGLTAATSP